MQFVWLLEFYITMLNHWTQVDRDKWDKLIATSPDGGILQSWGWGEFQEALGNAVYNISDENEEWLAQCIQLKAGNKWILTIPRGPVFVGSSTPAESSLGNFFNELTQFAKEHNCFLIRLDPAWPSDGLSKQSRVVKSRKERNPVHTLIVDTSKSEEELLKQMKSKHRYNIRLAEKKGVKARWSSSAKDAVEFFNLVRLTTERQGFGSYNLEYFKTMIRVMGESDNAKFLLAEFKGDIIAGLLVGFFGEYAYYLHGASDHEHRSLMAPHLLQWEAIKEAKRKGLKYDFWGVAADPPANKQEEDWGGVTRFKKGFAPETELTEYVGTYEIGVQKAWYFVYRMRQKLLSLF